MGFQQQIQWKTGRFCGIFVGIFRVKFAEKQLIKYDQFLGIFWTKFAKNQLGFAMIWPAFLTFFLTEIIIHSFNNNNIEKSANGKVFYIMASAQFFATKSSPGRFGTFVEDKFASLQQVKSPNSQDKFQICCTDVYSIWFLANFVAFCVFLWISRDFADLREFQGSATTQNIRSPADSRLQKLHVFVAPFTLALLYWAKLRK